MAVGSGEKTVIVKFGSSVIRHTGDYCRVVTEIYRHVRYGRKVVAVVSAMEGETDLLYREVAGLGVTGNSRHAPRLIALGEERSAARLALACEARGINARIAGARQISLHAGGAVGDAYPESVDVSALRRETDAYEAVIVPGFVALGQTGEPVLLGRGGSDLTAAFLAGEMGLGTVTLIKDVDGVYDLDPAGHADVARRYSRISWKEAGKVAGRLVQRKAVSYAEGRSLDIRVASMNSVRGTIIGAYTDNPSLPVPDGKCNVAIAGLGVIGEGMALRLMREGNIYSLCPALVRNVSRSRAKEISSLPLCTDADSFLDSRPDIVVDALSDGKAGERLAREALERGISVVSANKQAVAGHMEELHALARRKGALFCYSACVGGGTPMVETVRRAVRAGSVSKMSAILNGTVNFILHAMGEGAGFEDAIRVAQAAGFAEADPAADLSGEDARAKISILAREAYGFDPDCSRIVPEALDAGRAEKILRDGGVWKQVARIGKSTDGISARVGFERVDDDPLFRDTPGESNVLKVLVDDGTVFSCRGKGAGRRPTVESLMADIAFVVRSMKEEGADVQDCR